jgi:ABC-2 type transport system permease protein
MSALPSTLRYYGKVWLANARASLVREMEFRTNFFLGLLRQLLWLTAFIIFINAIFGNTQSLAGWSKPQVLVILALSRIIEGAMHMLFIDNLLHFTRTVNQGKFDFYLLKPIGTQFFTAFKNLKIDGAGNVLAGIGLLVYALTPLRHTLTFTGIVSFLLITMAGVAIYYSLLVMVASLVFKLERLEGLWGFNSLFSEPLTVPFDVFPGSARIALTYLVPVAFVVFIPAQALTGRLNFWQVPIAIVIAAIFLTLANLAWRAGLKRYSSASS